MANAARSRGKTIIYPRQQTNEWDSGLEFVNNCGKCRNNDYSIGMRPLAKMKIDALMEEYPRIEWLAYLVGYIDHERGYAEIQDLVVPDSQEISTATVDEVERNFDAVGVIHSHHNMNFGFSKTDWEYVNSNNDISIVVYNSGQSMECSMRVRADCGAITFIKPNLRLVFNDSFDKDGFIQDAKSKIHEFRGIGEFNYFDRYVPGRYGYSGVNKYPHTVPVNRDTSDVPDEYEELKELYQEMYGEDLEDVWEGSSNGDDHGNPEEDNAFYYQG